MSEDVLLIFVGTMLGNAEFTTSHKVACVAWCYAGVVVSDLVSAVSIKRKRPPSPSHCTLQENPAGLPHFSGNVAFHPQLFPSHR